MTSVDGNLYQKNMVVALKDREDGLSESELFEASEAKGRDRFQMHLDVLKRLGLVSEDEPYSLTEFGERIYGELEKIGSI